MTAIATTDAIADLAADFGRPEHRRVRILRHVSDLCLADACRLGRHPVAVFDLMAKPGLPNGAEAGAA